MDDDELIKLLQMIIWRQEKDILHLNQMLRETGYGQGQIDAYAAICEENESLKKELSKLGITKNEK